MNWQLWLVSGIKQMAYLIIGAVLTLLVEYLSASLGFKPSGALQEWLWNNGLYPMLVTAIALLKNWLQHRKEPVKK